MNIAVIGFFYDEGFALHISGCAKHMGHNVCELEIGINYKSQRSFAQYKFRQIAEKAHSLCARIPKIRQKLIQKLRARATSHKSKLIIVCYDFLTPDEVEVFKNISNCSVVMWFPDHIGNIGRSYFINAKYDAIFFKDPYMVSTFKKVLDKPIYYLPECFNPLSNGPVELSASDKLRYNCELATAGNMYAYRIEFFEQMHKYDVKLWGNPPPSWLRLDKTKSMLQNHFVTYQDKSKAFLGAKIVINNLNPAEIMGVNVRTFEIAGCGGFQILDAKVGVSDLFIVGDEIVTFNDMQDLESKIDFYLNNEEERARIAANGMRRALRDHTYQHRIQCLLDTVFSGGCGHAYKDNV
jgi:spore maturation protein CgeB